MFPYIRVCVCVCASFIYLWAKSVWFCLLVARSLLIAPVPVAPPIQLQLMLFYWFTICLRDGAHWRKPAALAIQLVGDQNRHPKTPKKKTNKRESPVRSTRRVFIHAINTINIAGNCPLNRGELRYSDGTSAIGSWKYSKHWDSFASDLPICMLISFCHRLI